MSTQSPTRRVATPREGAHVVEMQRRRLLLAIVEVASESGLEAATVGRVCEQANVSRRTFYELFEDRHACLLAAFSSETQSLADRMRPAFESNANWSERVREALRVLLESFDAAPAVARFCIVEIPRAGGEPARRHRLALEALASAVSQGAAHARGSQPPPLMAPGVVGGVLSVIQGRLLESGRQAEPRLLELLAPLMAMIVHPYLGAAASHRELDRPAPSVPSTISRTASDPFKGLPIRFTYRTARVLDTIAGCPGASNRHIAESSGISDDGQVSRLLARLSRCELIENRGLGHAKGEPNAWRLTERGSAVHSAIAQQGAAS